MSILRHKKHKLLYNTLAAFLFLVIFLALMNTRVYVLQGVDAQVNRIYMPLYLKVLDFFDRHFNYKLLAEKIISGATTQEEKAMRIFKWTVANIRENPKELPIVDDHVWHIIVRGYGVNDQLSDVFATLCNYAGLDAYFLIIYTQDQTRCIPLAFVKINNNWTVFDAYNRTYFKNKKGDIATIDDIKNGDWVITKISQTHRPVVKYNEFFENMPAVKEGWLNRANVQSPFKRLIYEVRKWMKLE